MVMEPVKRFHALDSFRGLCALAIVVYHLHAVGSITELGFFTSADLFVEFFFILSGFVITHAYGSKSPLDFKAFVVSRTFRLAPLHIVLLAAFVFFECLKLLAAQKGFNFNQEPFTGLYSPSQILPNLLLVQAWTPMTENLSFNNPSWSISIEYYTYLIFAAVSLFCFSKRRVVWFGISLVAAVMLYTRAGGFTALAYKGLACFFAGALAYSLFEVLRKVIRPSVYVASVFELLMLALIVVTLSSDWTDKAVMACTLFFLTVIIFSFDAGFISGLLRGKAFSFCGRLSYSIYLTHLIIIHVLILVFMIVEKKTGMPFAPMVGSIRFIDAGSALMNNLIVIVALLAVIGVSWFTYTVIEVNGQKMGRHIISNMRQAHLKGQHSRL
jgi:peptidoglycan/LPS O-acetylase OafA/YrhL